MNGPFQDALDMCTLFSSLCPQVGLAGGLRSSVYDFERYSTTPKPCLTSLPVCKSFLSCQCFLTKSKEDTSSKGSSRYFQKHEGWRPAAMPAQRSNLVQGLALWGGSWHPEKGQISVLALLSQ